MISDGIKDFKVSLHNSLKQLQKSGKEFVELFNHGSLSVEIYKPVQTGKQTTHTRDEIYVVVSGSGVFFSMEKELNFHRVMCSLLRPEKNIGLKILRMIL